MKDIDREYWNELKTNIEKDTLNSVSMYSTDKKSIIPLDKLRAYSYEIFTNYEKLSYDEVYSLFARLENKNLQERQIIDNNKVKAMTFDEGRSIEVSPFSINNHEIGVWIRYTLDLVEILETFSKIPEKDMHKFVLNPSAKDKEMRELYLFVAIKISKDYANKSNYQKAIELLRYFLDGIKHYHYFGTVYTILGYLSLFIFIILIFILIIYCIFIKIQNLNYNDLYIPIDIFYKLFLTSIMFPVMIILLKKIPASKHIEYGAFIFRDITNIKFSILNIFLIFPVLISALLVSIFVISPLFLGISAYVGSLIISINNFYINGFIVCIFGFLLNMILWGIFEALNTVYSINRGELKKKPLSYLLGNGLYHYYKGRFNVQKYLETKNEDLKSKFLEESIKEFNVATTIYDKSFSRFEKSNELGLCPFCLNFYLCIKEYEEVVTNPEESKIKDFENKIEKLRVIMDETGHGSKTVNELLNKLLKAMKSLGNLRTKSKNFSNQNPMNRAKIDKEIEENYEEIDNIIKEIDQFISNVEGRNLPLIIEIMEEKIEELNNLNTRMKKYKSKGFETFFSRQDYNLITILLYIVGFVLLVAGSFYSYIGIFTIISAILMSLPRTKKWVY